MEEDLLNKVEAILFAAGRVISLEEIAGLCNADKKDVKQALEEVSKTHKERESPLLVVEEGDGWKVTVREKYLSIVQKIVPSTELSKTILETLSIIAWKQPVAQSEVVDIRSNKAYDHVSELVDLGFITKERKGRSFVLRTTKKFAEYFDLHTIEEIKKTFNPVAEKVKLQQKAQAEAEKEAQPTMGGLKVVDVEPEKEQEESSEEKPSVELNGLDVYEGEKPKTSEEVEEKVETEETVEEEPQTEEKEEPTEEEIETKPEEKKESEEEKPETEEKKPEEPEGEVSLEKIQEKASEEFKQDIQKEKEEEALSDEEKAEKAGKGVEVKETGRKLDNELEEMIEINKDAKEKLEGKKEDITPKKEEVSKAAKALEEMEKQEEEEQKKEGMLVKDEGEEE